MLAYYNSITDVKRKCIIYDNFMDDSKRYIITRWRLSNHKLYIETGRYKTPPVERKDRKYSICDILEDEFHAIYHCPRFNCIRSKFPGILNKYRSIQSILNPELQDVFHISNLIHEIDSVLFT